MPKIIDNLQDRILEEVEREITEIGYSGMTIRSVANACNVAVGTVYNYFQSKEKMVAVYMAKDWGKYYGIMQAEGSRQKCVKDVMRVLYNNILAYMQAHSALFADAEAAKGFAGAYGSRHSLLRHQLSEIVEPICYNTAVNYTEDLSEFLVEALLSWVTEGKNYNGFCVIIEPLFIREETV